MAFRMIMPEITVSSFFPSLFKQFSQAQPCPIIPASSHAIKPQQSVWNFCLSILELSELRTALICLSRAGRLKIQMGSEIRNYENSILAAGILLRSTAFFLIVLFHM